MQGEQGLFDVDRPKTKESGPTMGYALSVNVGGEALGLKVLISLAEYFETYMPTITIDGLPIELNEDLQPTPKELTRFILEQPGSKYQKIKQDIEALKSMNDDDVRRLAHVIDNLNKTKALPQSV